MTKTGPGFPSMIASAASMCAGDRSPSPTPACLWHRSSSLPVANSCVSLGLSGCRASRACRHPGRGCSRQPPLFEEIPAERQRHQLGARERDVGRPLPAGDHGAGRGVRRLRQRRLDGHLHGQQRRRAISTTPATPLKNALYKNNRDGTFTDVTDKAGVAGGTEFGMGCAIARLRQRRLSRHPRHRVRPVHALPQQRQRHVHRRHREGRRSRRPAGRPAPSGSTTTTTASSICSSAASSQFSLTSNVFCGDNKLGKRFYCIPRVFKPTPSLLFHNNGDGTFTEVSAGTDIQRALGKALGVVATDINGDGLMDLFVANDTVQNFLFANRGKGKWDEIGARGRSRLQRQRHAAIRAWASTPPTSTATASRISSSPTSTRRCSRSTRTTATSSSRDVAGAERRRAGDAAAERLGPEVLRLRQRRPRRSVPRQRPSRRHDRELLAAGAATRSRCCCSTTTARSSRT